jgi:signal transduction histidine kinase
MSVTLNTDRLAHTLPDVPVLIVSEAVRECLNNASYHCLGAAVTVKAASLEGVLVVTVNDNGPGCNPEEVMATWALKENAIHLVETAGGGYSVESARGIGTTVRLTFPLPGQPAASRPNLL